MANTKSAKKNIRKNKRRYEINLNRKSEVKTVVKKILTSMSNNEDIDVVKDLMRNTESEISRAKNKIYHSNTASRKISKLAKKVAKYCKSKQNQNQATVK